MPQLHDFHARDGTRLSCHTMGEGPALLLLHGLFSNAQTNWIEYGTARRIADAGYRVIMPDLRGHGESDTPADPAAWPDDILAQDIEDLVSHLGLGDDFHLGGYSLGARTVSRLLIRGMRPRSCIMAGMGLDGMRSMGERVDWFIRMIKGRGNWPKNSAEYHAERFMNASIRDPEAMILLLRAQPDSDMAQLSALDLKTLVIVGARDDYRLSAEQLADALPNADFAEIPGNHMTCISRPELGERIIGFLAES